MFPEIINSYAKINLGLCVINQRDDNYHNIESIFIQINLSDQLTFTQSKKFNLQCKNINPEILTKNNTIYKAYSMLNQLFEFKNHYKIVLNKRIPLCAGLGGGSSNAAITLKTLNI